MKGPISTTLMKSSCHVRRWPWQQDGPAGLNEFPGGGGRQSITAGLLPRSRWKQRRRNWTARMARFPACSPLPGWLKSAVDRGGTTGDQQPIQSCSELKHGNVETLEQRAWGRKTIKAAPGAPMMETRRVRNSLAGQSRLSLQPRARAIGCNAWTRGIGKARFICTLRKKGLCRQQMEAKWKKAFFDCLLGSMVRKINLLVTWPAWSRRGTWWAALA